MLTVDQILSLIQSHARQIIHEQQSFSTVMAQTTDATPVEILRLTPDDNSCGLLTVSVVGADGTGGVSGMLAKRFTKYSGVITTTSDIAIIPVSGITGTTVSIASDGVDLVVSVTGVAATTINWKGDYKLITVQNEIAL